MKYYRDNFGGVRCCLHTVSSDQLTEITKDEYEAVMNSFNKKCEASAEEESKAQQIAELKAQLAATDYKALKFMEGWLTEEEYAPIRAKRQAIRDIINALEAGG